MSTLPKQFVTPKDYLERERDSEDNHDYFAEKCSLWEAQVAAIVRMVSNLVLTLP